MKICNNLKILSGFEKHIRLGYCLAFDNADIMRKEFIYVPYQSHLRVLNQGPS